MNNYYIPEPCHEKWNQMTPKEKGPIGIGRHCDVCNKVVVDFTKQSSEEINRVMDQADGNVCGRFNLTQLNQQAQMKVFRQPSNLLNRNWKYFVMAALGFFAFGKKSIAQKGAVRLAGKPALTTNPNENSNTSVTKIYGTVLSPDNKPLAGANVMIYSNGETVGTTMTIANGSYVLNIDRGKIKDKKIAIEASYGSYMPKYINELSVDKTSTRINLQLEEDFFIMGDIAPVEEPIFFPDSLKNTIVNPVPVEPKKDIEKIIEEKPPVHNEEKQDAGDDIVVENINTLPDETMAVIYPNPTGNHTIVSFDKADLYMLEVFDVKGSLQQSRQFLGDKTQLDVSGLSRGTYFVKVKNDTGLVQTLKLVKN